MDRLRLERRPRCRSPRYRQEVGGFRPRDGRQSDLVRGKRAPTSRRPPVPALRDADARCAPRTWLSGENWLALMLVAGAACGTSRILNPDAVGPKGEKHLVEFYCAPQDDCGSLAKEACGGPNEVVTKSGAIGQKLLVRCTDRVTRTVDTGAVGPHGEPALEVVCIEALGACMDAFRRTCQGDFDIIASNNGDWLLHCLTPPNFVPPLPAAPLPPDTSFALDGGLRSP
jgi:hypothetical protein